MIKRGPFYRPFFNHDRFIAFRATLCRRACCACGAQLLQFLSRKQWNQIWIRSFGTRHYWFTRWIPSQRSWVVHWNSTLARPWGLFSWTFWADLGVKKHLGDPVLMGLYQIYQLSPNSWRLITMIRSASFDPNCQTACSPNKGGPRRPSSARSSEVSCLPSLLMAWRGPAGTCHFAELVLRIPYCIYSRMTLLVYDMIWYNII